MAAMNDWPSYRMDEMTVFTPDQEDARAAKRYLSKMQAELYEAAGQMGSGRYQKICQVSRKVFDRLDKVEASKCMLRGLRGDAAQKEITVLFVTGCGAARLVTLWDLLNCGAEWLALMIMDFRYCRKVAEFPLRVTLGNAQQLNGGGGERGRLFQPELDDDFDFYGAMIDEIKDDFAFWQSLNPELTTGSQVDDWFEEHGIDHMEQIAPKIEEKLAELADGLDAHWFKNVLLPQPVTKAETLLKPPMLQMVFTWIRLDGEVAA